MKPIQGHALNGYDRNSIWRPGRGTWIAARQWHREHKAEIADKTNGRRAL